MNSIWGYFHEALNGVGTGWHHVLDIATVLGAALCLILLVKLIADEIRKDRKKE